MLRKVILQFMQKILIFLDLMITQMVFYSTQQTV
uniref:Uncharacterized protein n=1 Tax=Myoviridae sp. ctCo31 TaxID=2825053 RepID=A0A8S5UM77_9CAUD|nr:MAG TPA: hypothetical protein [Myoviridae sp. ctCo31]